MSAVVAKLRAYRDAARTPYQPPADALLSRLDRLDGLRDPLRGDPDGPDVARLVRAIRPADPFGDAWRRREVTVKECATCGTWRGGWHVGH